MCYMTCNGSHYYTTNDFRSKGDKTRTLKFQSIMESVETPGYMFIQLGIGEYMYMKGTNATVNKIKKYNPKDLVIVITNKNEHINIRKSNTNNHLFGDTIYFNKDITMSLSEFYHSYRNSNHIPIRKIKNIPNEDALLIYITNDLKVKFNLPLLGGFCATGRTWSRLKDLTKYSKLDLEFEFDDEDGIIFVKDNFRFAKYPIYFENSEDNY